MNEKIVQEILDELFSSLEALETRSAAVLQFLKDKGIANGDELAPYLEQARNASSVRWLAARVRIEHLLAAAMKSSEDDGRKESAKVTEKVAEKSQEANRAANKSEAEADFNKAKSAQDAAIASKTPEREADAPVGTKENEEKINQEKKKDEENAEAGRNTNTDDAKNAA